jgi:hypothetical protein
MEVDDGTADYGGEYDYGEEEEEETKDRKDLPKAQDAR